MLVPPPPPPKPDALPAALPWGTEADRRRARPGRDVFEPPAESAFDRATALVARLLDVPVVMLGLAEGERAWFKSRPGLLDDELRRELRRCGRVVETGGVGGETADAARDSRWERHPLVTGPFGMRAFLAVPLRMAADGPALGSICVVDRRARTWTAADRATLGDLAGTILDELELRRAAHARLRAESEASATRYRELFEASPQPMWVYDPETLRFLAVNDTAVRLYGYAREEFLEGMTLADIRPPEDVPALLTEVHQPADADGRLLWRHRRKDGSLFDVEVTSNRLTTYDGRPARLVMAYNVSERVAAEEALQTRERHLAGLVETQRELLRATAVHGRIPHLLGILGQCAAAARACYYRIGREPAPDGRLYADLMAEWCAPEVRSLRDDPTKGTRVYPADYSVFRAWFNQLQRDEIVILGERPDLPEPERRFLEERGMRSILFAPLLVRDVLAGVLSFHYLCRPHALLHGDHNPLHGAATALAQAFEREAAVAELATEKERLAVALGTLSERDRYLAALVAAQRELLNEPDVADGALERFLARLGQAAGADRVYFYDQLRDEHNGEPYLRQRGEWCAPGLPAGLGGVAVQRLPLKDLRPGWRAELEAGQIILGAVDEQTPPLERALLEARQVRFGLLLPVMVRGEFAGGLGFDNCQTLRPCWNEAEIDHLRAAAAALALALERERSAQALAAETHRLAVTLSALTEGVLTTDAEGRVVLLNRAAETLTGCPAAESIGRPLREVFRTFEAAEGGEPRTANDDDDYSPERFPLAEQRHHVWLEGREGQRRLIDKVAIPVLNDAGRFGGVVRVFRDVTDEERLSAEMLKASKLESLGILAGGIAHDFNNILTAILGNVSLARRVVVGLPADEKLDQAERACARARDLTGQLLTFARGGAPSKKLARLPEIIRESVGFALHGSPVGVKFDLPADLWPVEADTGQLSQVLNNLAINAVQAMGRDGGALEVRAENLSLSDGVLPSLPGGRYVKISLEDDGGGISAEHLEKIFDPFFSTKPGGSGLGLATSYSIAKRHGGHLNVDSVPGVGSIFRFYLPAAGEKSEVGVGKGEKEAKGEVRATDGAPGLPAAGLRVLVLEDEPTIQALLGDMLGHLGAEAVVTAAGAETIECHRRARAEGRPFDLLILDLTVPGGMGGREVLTTLRGEDPGVHAVVSSGYAEDPIASQYAQHGFAGVLNKPYRLDELVGVLEAVPR